MTYHEFAAKYLAPFRGVRHFYDAARGWIVWRRGTGDNVELLHVRTFTKGKGHGRQLFYVFLDGLKESPPYYSVFGFTRSANEEAQAFYGALGFNLRPLEGLYADGTAVLFWQSYEALLARRQEYEDNLRS